MYIHEKSNMQCQNKEGANPGQLFQAFGPVYTVFHVPKCLYMYVYIYTYIYTVYIHVHSTLGYLSLTVACTV